MDSDSWMIQVEVVQQELLGAGPQDEDPILENIQNFAQAPFAFFGLGQQGPGLNQNAQGQNQGPPDQQPQQQAPNPQQANAPGNNWDFWPDVLPAIG